jgi:subfamily B ATP-binding cassette protein MsbA
LKGHGDLGRILALVRPHRWLLVAALALSVAGSALESLTLVTLVPLLKQLFGAAGAVASGGTALERWLDDVTRPLLEGTTPDQAVGRMVVVLLAGLLLKNVATYSGQQLSVRVQERVVATLRTRLFRHLLALDLDFHRKSRLGELVTLVMQEAQQVRSAVTGSLIALVRNAVTIVGTLAVLFSISPRLTAVAVLALPPMVIGIRLLLDRLRRHSRARTAENAAVGARVSERLSSVRLVRLTAAEELEGAAFERIARGYAKKVERAARFSSLTGPLTEVFAVLSTILILYAGTHPQLLGLDAALSPQVIVVFLMASLRLTSPFKGLSRVQADWVQAMTSLERISALLDQPVTEVDPPGARAATFAREVVVDRVSFSYPGGPPVLSDVSLALSPGRTVALVGPSGSGKSTLADLLPRLHEPTSGEIRFDGVPATQCTYRSVRALVAFVSQETLLLHDTVHANIAYGLPSASRDAVEAAARAANAHEFIAELPQGYDTVLGERGSRLSGGQRQRLAIARALLRDAPLLVLDEATSALDTASERLVQEAIERLMAGRAVLVIAHRLATIRQADEILVMEAGRIVQRGTHAALLAEGGAYRRLYEAQFRDESLAPAENGA